MEGFIWKAGQKISLLEGNKKDKSGNGQFARAKSEKGRQNL